MYTAHNTWCYYISRSIKIVVLKDTHTLPYERRRGRIDRYRAISRGRYILYMGISMWMTTTKLQNMYLYHLIYDHMFGKFVGVFVLFCSLSLSHSLTLSLFCGSLSLAHNEHVFSVCVCVLKKPLLPHCRNVQNVCIAYFVIFLFLYFKTILFSVHNLSFLYLFYTLVARCLLKNSYFEKNSMFVWKGVPLFQSGLVMMNFLQIWYLFSFHFIGLDRVHEVNKKEFFLCLCQRERKRIDSRCINLSNELFHSFRIIKCEYEM